MTSRREEHIVIRPVEQHDAVPWSELRATLWPEETTGTHLNDIQRYFETMPKDVGMMPEEVLVAVTTGREKPKIVGFVELSRRLYAEGCRTSPVAFLEGWYVLPEYRERGIGRALVAAAETWARHKGCDEFASDALADNAESQAAHQALGFEEVEVIRCFRKSLD